MPHSLNLCWKTFFYIRFGYSPFNHLAIYYNFNYPITDLVILLHNLLQFQPFYYSFSHNRYIYTTLFRNSEKFARSIYMFSRITLALLIILITKNSGFLVT
ncbi:hypothetical protein ACJX0J_018904 [Zea mays]